MQPAPPSPSSGWGPGLRARPLVEFAARCPNVGASVRCLGCHSFPKWLHQARLQPRLTCGAPGRARLAAPWSCCPYRSRLQAPGAEAPSGWLPPVLHSLKQVVLSPPERTALCLSLQPPRRRLQEQLHHQSSATPARGRLHRQDAEAQPAAGRELLLAPVLLVRARLGCDTSAVVGRVLDAAAALLGTEEWGGPGEGALSAGALGTWLLVARGATWSLASGEPGRGNSWWGSLTCSSLLHQQTP